MFSAATKLSISAYSAYSPISLFSGGQQGYWLDPSDFTTMWQDHQGVTPVTATGQSCGLILDKRIGTRTQVFNDANVTFGGIAGYAGRVSTGVYQYARTAGGSGSVFFGGLTTGRTYLISVQASAYAGAVPGITNISLDFRSALNVQFRPAASAAGTHTAFYVADGTTFRIGGALNGAGATISNVSILEVAGNHFLQSAASNRPILGVEPAGGRRNLLLHSGLTGATSGTPGTAPTGWTLFVGNGSTTVIPGGGSLGGDAIRLTMLPSALRQVYNQAGPTLAANSTYIFSVQCNVHSALGIQGFINFANPPTGSTLEFLIDGVVVPGTTPLPLGLCTAAVRVTTSTTAGAPGLRLGPGTLGNTTGDVTFWDPQLELGSTRTAYQRVTDQWNVTQAGVTPCYYLAFDGTDDWLQSVATINPGAVDKVQVFAGVRKLSDAAAGVVVESSISTATNNGSLGLYAPGSAAPTYLFATRGTSRALNEPTGYTAPITNVVTGLGDISAPSSIVRVNGTQVGSALASQGTGDYLTHTHYIGRRGGTSLPLNGRIYQLITRFGANLSDGQITQTETFVNQRTGAY